MPQGKPAGVPCVQLDEQLRCKIFGQPERPAVCGQLQASVEMCGTVEDGGVHARAWLMQLEDLTRPDSCTRNKVTNKSSPHPAYR
jgi:uncharacterized protein